MWFSIWDGDLNVHVLGCANRKQTPCLGLGLEFDKMIVRNDVLEKYSAILCVCVTKFFANPAQYP